MQVGDILEGSVWRSLACAFAQGACQPYPSELFTVNLFTDRSSPYLPGNSSLDYQFSAEFCESLVSARGEERFAPVSVLMAPLGRQVPLKGEGGVFSPWVCRDSI